jgi:hypothetical protein
MTLRQFQCKPLAVALLLTFGLLAFGGRSLASALVADLDSHQLSNNGISEPAVTICAEGDTAGCQAELAKAPACRDIACANEQLALMQLSEANSRVKQICTKAPQSEDCKIATGNSTKMTDAIKVAAANKWSRPAVGGAFEGPPVDYRGVYFEFNSDQTAGDCVTRSGAKLELRKNTSNNGLDLHYTAQIYTHKSIMGDVWHVSWRLEDEQGNPVLVTKMYDLPPGSRMHPQFGNYDIDLKDSIPLSSDEIQRKLSSVRKLVTTSSC